MIAKHNLPNVESFSPGLWQYVLASRYRLRYKPPCIFYSTYSGCYVLKVIFRMIITCHDGTYWYVLVRTGIDKFQKVHTSTHEYTLVMEKESLLLYIISKVRGAYICQICKICTYAYSCIFLHISCIFYCISGAYQVHISAYFLHILCIFLHIHRIFSAYICISGAYQVHIVAYFLHILCIFHAYSLHISAYKVHISAYKVHIRCICLHIFCIDVHISGI